MGYSFRLAAWVILYAPSHIHDSIYRGLWYTSRGALAGSRNSSMGPPWRIDPTTHRTMSERSYHGATSRSNLHDDSILKIKKHTSVERRLKQSYDYLCHLISEASSTRRLPLQVINHRTATSCKVLKKTATPKISNF